jgi:SAM-dependent methyltransferase
MKDLSHLGMWQNWQQTVRDAYPKFAKCPIYVEQNSVPEARFEKLACEIFLHGSTDAAGKLRDAEYGARVVMTSLGPVTRMWLESNVEIHFLQKYLPNLKAFNVLDIGAGYGRLAVPLSKCAGSVTCVDAVPISTEICREYCGRFAPEVNVISLAEFQGPWSSRQFDLAINIHSFNECSIEQIEAWLDTLKEMRVPFLFTVSHGQMDHSPEPSYRAWQEGACGPSWRHLLEERYTLVAEEELGLSPSPHALWHKK